MTVTSFIAGAAQASFREVDFDRHPSQLMAQMAEAALADVGVPDGAQQVDLVACVEALSWTYEDLAGEVAREIGCPTEVETLWVPAGGTSPQDLLHKIVQRIDAGDINCAVIAGSEAMRTRLRAIKQEHELNWPARPKGMTAIRGQKPFANDFEKRHGLRSPIHVFPLYENALRAALKRTAEEQVLLAAELLAKNAAVASKNEHAWFHDAPNAQDIATVTQDNRMIAYPYTKRMNAIMDVDQAAAIVVVSEKFMDDHGLRDRCAAVLGGSGAEDPWFASERTAYSESPAMKQAFGTTLNQAGITTDEFDGFDLYSCFPSAIELALLALGVEPEDQRPFSLTGGLAFAGGPGNAYVLHSLACALDRIRAHPDSKLVVTGVGMSNTKHAATALGHANHVPSNSQGRPLYREDTGIEPATITERASGDAKIVTYTIEYDREGTPVNDIFVLDLPDGTRTLANAVDTVVLAQALLDQEPIGRTGKVVHDTESNRNLFAF